ncbi:MFS transporter [Treponema primitia]|uniref:MFS transporter n=1 Tax=Treponema primitia TaxID=88058 RepID=UPI00025556C3|nr:MFS transporter [Treponema primitia]
MYKNWKRNTVLFLTGQAISLFGSALVHYAIVWYITLHTRSGAMMTVAIICGSLPTFFISPFGGVWADRYNRKLLINIADGIIALSTLAMALFFILHGKIDLIWLLFLNLGIRALGTGVQTPAVNALIPQLVPDEHLTRVNGINSSVNSLSSLLAPMLSGALLSFSRIEYIFFIDVATAVIGINIVFIFVHIPGETQSLWKKAAGTNSRSYFEDLKKGCRYMLDHGFIKRMFIFSVFFFLLITPGVFLTPLQIARKFGGEVWRLSVMEILFSAGMILGGLLISVWGGFKNRVRTMAFACFLFGCGDICLGLVPHYGIYIMVMAFSGMIVPFFNTPFTVLLQEKVESQFMGRVFSFQNMISSIMMPLGMIVFGPLGDVIPISRILVFCGSGTIILGGFFIGNRVLREGGEQFELERIENAD